MLTLHDICERLEKIDEVSLLEVLEINSEELVERFVDKIETKFESLQEELEDV